MGSEEDTEPSLKRVKETSLTKLNGLLGNSSSSLMARTIPSVGDGDGDGDGDVQVVGLKGVIKKQEFVKIIMRELYSLGYYKTGALLEQESGIRLHTSILTSFMQLVLDGKWDDSLSTLRLIGVSVEAEKLAAFTILEQKLLEFLQSGNIMGALATLRSEISPLSVNMNRVHELAACIVSCSDCVNSGIATVLVSPRLQIVEKLQKLLPAAMVVPEGRLEHLVEQALDVQRDSCVFHNTFDSELSLYTDHQCERTHIPSQTLQVLEAHNDEIWYLQFSHSGKYLASASKDQLAIIWEVHENGRLSLTHTLIGHQKPVMTVSWSHDDSQLLTCGLEEVVRRWDVTSGKCLHVYEKPGVGLVSCGWFPDGQGVFSGVMDKSICLWGLDGKEVECWKGQRTLRISDMAITDDGKIIISICRESAILLLDREAKFERLIEEDQVITSFSLSQDSKFLLVNLINQEIHLWSIEGDLKVISKYKGHKRSRFLIRSCFGGTDQAFIASGSEDSQVYIWHRSTEELLVAVSGHSGAVNSVSWNPSNPHMLASASDDRTIRIWGLSRLNLASQGKHNGVQGNGFTLQTSGIV